MDLNMQDFKQEFDNIFTEELGKLIQGSNNILQPHKIHVYIEYLLKIASNGKRIRPYNAALTYSIYSGKSWHNIKNTLIGIELVHLMALIHDDIMDNSETRHGIVSTHSFIKNDLKNKVPEDEVNNTGQSLAILLGDLVFAWAFAKFSEDNQSKESWTVINSVVEEVMLGQMMDVYNPNAENVSIEIIERKMLLKTARYTFTRPLLLGAVLSGTEKEKTSWIQNFGDSAGLLFQMQDDIFDITKDVTTLKKDPLGDIKNGTHTLISTYVIQNTNEESKEIWNKWFGNKQINNQEEIKQFVSSTGALDFAENYINQKESSALGSIDESSLDENSKIKIKSLLQEITKRRY